MPKVRVNRDIVEVQLPSYGTEEPVIVKLDRNLKTEHFLSFSEATTDEQKALALLVKCIVSWNLQNEDGSPLPVTEEAIKVMPVTDFITMVKVMKMEELKNGISTEKKSS